jgi:ureidoglycolate hydrolase
VRPLPSLPLAAKVMERHEFSSQSFLPLDFSRWIGRRLAVVMWRDGTRTDEEFRTLAAPFTVELPGG